MSLFHKHLFKESTNNPEIIFCPCGKTKSLHQCIWKIEERHVITNRNNNDIGACFVLKCEKCGEIKHNVIKDL